MEPRIKKKIKDLSNSQILKYVETLGDFEKCKYCPVNSTCTKTATRKNRGEILFPQCVNGDIKTINLNVVKQFKSQFEDKEIELSPLLKIDLVQDLVRMLGTGEAVITKRFYKNGLGAWQDFDQPNSTFKYIIEVPEENKKYTLGCSYSDTRDYYDFYEEPQKRQYTLESKEGVLVRGRPKLKVLLAACEYIVKNSENIEKILVPN